MTTEIQLTGPWPTGSETQLAALLSKDVKVKRADHSVLGAIPWGDIASLVSAAAAAASVAINFWALKREAKIKKSQNPEDLSKVIRREGIFGLEVVSIHTDANKTKNLKIEISDQTSGGRHQFIAELDKDRISISIDQEHKQP